MKKGVRNLFRIRAAASNDRCQEKVPDTFLGFSLLEVVLALAILAGGRCAALGEVMRLADVNAAAATDESQAETLAESVTSELLVGASPARGRQRCRPGRRVGPALGAFDRGGSDRFQRTDGGPSARRAATGAATATGPLRTRALVPQSGLLARSHAAVDQFERLIVHLLFVLLFLLLFVERRAAMRTRSAFTLFELILAIAISVTLLALIGTAINLYLLASTPAARAFEEAQLARSILATIAADVRATTTYQTQDISAIARLAAGAASFDVDNIDSSGTFQGGTLGTPGTSGGPNGQLRGDSVDEFLGRLLQ